MLVVCTTWTQIAQKEKNINDLIKYSNLYEQTRNSIVDSLHFENTRSNTKYV